MLTSIVALTLLVPPTGFTASMERLAMSKGGASAPTVVIDALEARVMVTNAKLSGRFESTLCPVIEVRKDGFTLTCATRRLWAGLVEDEHGLFLDLRSLQGVPWEGDAALPTKSWPMRALGITDECPGRLDATRAECAFEAGKFDEAEVLYKKSRAGPDANFAYLRLGDLAMMRGDPEAAVHLYAFVPTVGPVGRIARARLCDLTGSCLGARDSTVAGDTFGVPEPLNAELLLSMWRREIFMGRESTMMPSFVKTLQGQPGLCHDTLPLCQKILILGLKSPDENTQTEALNGWLATGIRRGPYEIDLALAAGSAAEKLGAPVFAATVLASISSKVPKADLPKHLLKVITLYIAGHDLIRAGVILDYADATVGKQARGPEWAAARARIEPAVHPERTARPVGSNASPKKNALPTTDELEASVGVAKELARAAAMRSRAQEPDHD